MHPGRGCLQRSKDMSSRPTRGCLEEDLLHPWGSKPLTQGELQPRKAAHPVCCPEAGSRAAQLGAHSACGLWLGPLLGPGIWEGLVCAPGAHPQWATMNVAERKGSLAVGGERS